MYKIVVEASIYKGMTGGISKTSLQRLFKIKT